MWDDIKRLHDQVGLAQRLRAQGYRIANERLRWLAAASGLESRRERP